MGSTKEEEDVESLLFALRGRLRLPPAVRTLSSLLCEDKESDRADPLRTIPWRLEQEPDADFERSTPRLRSFLPLLPLPLTAAASTRSDEPEILRTTPRLPGDDGLLPPETDDKSLAQVPSLPYLCWKSLQFSDMIFVVVVAVAWFSKL